MYKDDDRLEEALNSVESRQNWKDPDSGEQVSDEIPSLVRLAASIRGLAHPVPDAAVTRAEKRRIMAAAKHKKTSKRSIGWSRNGGFTGQWMVLPAVAGAALLVLMVFVLAAGAGMYFSGPRGANAATLSSASGTVEVLDSGEWVAVSDGYRVKSGGRIRTGSESGVILTFFDGSQVSLDPNTDLMLSDLAGDWGGKLQVAMIQNEGETSHQVVPLKGANSSYNVLTPSGEASVRGTSFNVLVGDTGDSVFTVDTGAVLVSNDGEEAFLAAGQGVVTELGMPMAAPSYLFALQGELQSNSGKTWVVEGVPITVKGGTRISGDPQVGDTVLVNGRITKKNEWIADSIHAALPGDNGGTFTGMVTGVNEDGVEINGYQFVILDEQPEVAVGDFVHVQFMISNGTWVILTLSPLDGDVGEEPEPEPEPEPEEPAAPETLIYFDPASDGSDTCQAVGSFSTTLKYTTTDEEALPLEVNLIVTVVDGAEHVNPVVVEPESPFFIDPNSDTPVTVTLELIEGLAELPPGSEVKVSIQVQDVATEEFIAESFEYKWECEQEEEPEEEDQDDNGDKCNRDKQHPHALTLAEEYGEAVGVDYDQIWSWFCEDNLGFGEIELAFKLYLEYGEVLGDEFTVYEIIDMRLTGGFGWGQIKQALKQAERDLLSESEVDTGKKVPPGKEKSEDAKNKDKPNKKDN